MIGTSHGWFGSFRQKNRIIQPIPTSHFVGRMVVSDFLTNDGKDNITIG
jgi:hypothetical protein